MKWLTLVVGKNSFVLLNVCNSNKKLKEKESNVSFYRGNEKMVLQKKPKI